MKNLKVRKTPFGRIQLSVTMDAKEAVYLHALINYAPTRNIPYLGENATVENKFIDAIRDMLSNKGIHGDTVEIHKNVKRNMKSEINFYVRTDEDGYGNPLDTYSDAKRFQTSKECGDIIVRINGVDFKIKPF